LELFFDTRMLRRLGRVFLADDRKLKYTRIFADFNAGGCFGRLNTSFCRYLKHGESGTHCWVWFLEFGACGFSNLLTVLYFGSVSLVGICLKSYKVP
jgi:hypothetical protein